MCALIKVDVLIPRDWTFTCRLIYKLQKQKVGRYLGGHLDPFSMQVYVIRAFLANSHPGLL